MREADFWGRASGGNVDEEEEHGQCPKGSINGGGRAKGCTESGHNQGWACGGAWLNLKSYRKTHPSISHRRTPRTAGSDSQFVLNAHVPGKTVLSKFGRRALFGRPTGDIARQHTHAPNTRM